MASTRCDKWFDITYVLKKFNANEELTFGDIASEFGMSEEELEKRLTTLAGSDEKDRVKRAKKNNKKRMRRKDKVRDNNQESIEGQEMEVATEEEAMNESTLEETMDERTMNGSDQSTTSQLELKRSELRMEIEQAEEKLSISQTAFASIKLEAEATQRILDEFQNEVDSRADIIRNLETKLHEAKTKLVEIRKKLNAATKKAAHDAEQLQVAEAKMQEDQEYLEALREELESLDDFVVNLIDPNYDLTKGLPDTGRLLSTVELDGVDVETPESDIDQLGFSMMITISRKTGFDNILELGTAYEFAWLVVKYKTDSNFETHVITDDARILKLIDLLME